MTTYASANDYIAEERRQLMNAITAVQRRLTRLTGRQVDFETAKREFLARDFDTFAVAFRDTHAVRG